MSDPFQTPNADPNAADSNLEGDVDIALLAYDHRRRRMRVTLGLAGALIAIALAFPSYLFLADYQLRTFGGYIVIITATGAFAIAFFATAPLTFLSAFFLERALHTTRLHAISSAHKVSPAALDRALRSDPDAE